VCEHHNAARFGVGCPHVVDDAYSADPVECPLGAGCDDHQASVAGRRCAVREEEPRTTNGAGRRCAVREEEPRTTNGAGRRCAVREEEAPQSSPQLAAVSGQL